MIVVTDKYKVKTEVVSVIIDKYGVKTRGYISSYRYV